MLGLGCHCASCDALLYCIKSIQTQVRYHHRPNAHRAHQGIISSAWQEIYLAGMHLFYILVCFHFVKTDVDFLTYLILSLNHCVSRTDTGSTALLAAYRTFCGSQSLGIAR